jgi:hypothetical protein
MSDFRSSLVGDDMRCSDIASDSERTDPQIGMRLLVFSAVLVFCCGAVALWLSFGKGV